MTMNLKLNDVLPNPLDNEPGIISKIQIYNPPWGSLNVSALLDIEYTGNISGNKIVSPLIDRILKNDNITDNKLSENRLTQLANLIYTMYNNKWQRLWSVTQSEYNPIENYNMVENGTGTNETEHGETITRTDNTTKNTSATRTDNLTHVKSGTETETPNVTETHTPNVTETNTPNLTHTVESDIYGFNSNDGQPANSGTERNTGTNTIQRTGTDTLTRTGTQQKTYNLNDADTGTQGTISEERDTGTQTHAHTGTDTETTEHELRRHGNIGVTTSQQMLQSEIELWQWNFFNDVLFPDLDSVLTIQVY